MTKIEPNSPRIPTVELIRHFSEYADTAIAQPIVITKNGRDRFVLMSVDLYRNIKQERIAREPNKNLSISSAMVGN